MIAWPPLRMRIFIMLEGVTSATNWTPTSSKRRAAGGESVLDHPLHEVLAEHRPGVLDAELVAGDRALAVGGRRRDAVDHAVREGDVSRTQPASSGSCAAARPTTAFAATSPLWGMLSQDMHGEGRDARRRGGRFRPARIRPNTVFGASGFAASATIAGMLGIELAGGRDR